MARRLNTRLLVLLLVFVGLPIAVLVTVIATDVLTVGETGNFQELFEQAKQARDNENWAAAYTYIRRAVKTDEGKDSAEAQYLRGYLALRQKPPAAQASRQSFQRALALKPDYFEAQRDLTELLIAMRLWNDAEREVQNLIQVKPDFARGYLWAAAIKLSLADAEPIQSRRRPFYEAAVEILSEGIEAAPGEMQLYALLARTYTLLGQEDQIAAVLDQAIASNPEEPQAYTMKAGRLAAQEEYDQAAEVLALGLVVAGEKPELFIALGEVAVKQNKIGEAKDAFQKAVDLAADDPRAYLRLAALYRADGDNTRAADVLDRAIERLPESESLKTERADLLLDEKEYEKATALIVEMEEANPESGNVAYLRGKQAMIDREIRRAITLLQKARDAGATPRARLLLGRAYFMAGELGAAESELQDLVAQLPTLLGARRTLAEIQLRLQEFDGVIRNARAVLAATPGDADMQLLLSQALAAQDNLPQALDVAQKGAAARPQDVRLHVMVAEILNRMDRVAEAEEAFLAAKAIGEDPEMVYRQLLQFYRQRDMEEKLEAALAEAREKVPDAAFVAADIDPEKIEAQLKARLQEDPTRYGDQVALARLYAVTDRQDQGMRIYQEVLEKAEPGSGAWRQAWQQVFMTHLQGDDYAAAAEVTERLRQADPNAPELLVAEPLVDLAQDRVADATEKLRQVVANDPSMSAANYLLAQALLRQQKFEDAKAVLQRALEMRPNLVPARLMLGRVLYREGAYTGAEAEAREALKFTPRYVPALELAAEATTAQGKWEDALRYREALAQVAPGNAPNQIAAARLYQRLDRLDLAEARFKAAHEAMPDDPRLVRALAEFYGLTRRHDDARKLIQEFITAYPDDPAGYILKGEYTARFGDIEDAEPFYRQALELKPEDPAPLVLYGDQLTAQGKWAKAEAIHKELVKRFPDNIHARRRLADIYMLQMKLEEAAEAIEAVLADHPDDVQSLVIRGRIASRRQDLKDAETYMRRALEEDPDYGEARFWLAELYAASDPLEAINQLDQIEPADGAFEKAMLLRSSINARRGLMRESVLDLRRLVDYRPTSFMGRSALAERYMATGEPGRASDLLEGLVRERPEPELFVRLGRAKLAQNRPAEALRHFEQARKLAPESPEALVGVAQSLMALDRRQEALDRVYNVMNSLPKEVWPRLALVTVHEAEGELNKAIDVLQTGLVQNNQWEIGYVRLAHILRQASQAAEPAVQDRLTQQARQVLMSGLQAMPQSVQIRTLLGNIEVEAENYERAVTVLEPVATYFGENYSRLPQDVPQLRPYFAGVRLYSLALYYLGRVDEAVDWGTKLWQIEPTDVANANNVAWMLATEKRDLDRAWRMVRTCARLVPDNPQILDTYGWVAFLRGDAQEAMDTLRQSIARGDNAEARYHLGRVLQDRGRVDEAREQYETALEMGLKANDAAEAEKRLEALKTAGAAG